MIRREIDMPQREIEIRVGEVSDVEAHVSACYEFAPAAQIGKFVGSRDVELYGTVRGPYCATARTLPATFEFHMIGQREERFLTAEAVIADPCLWSAELPHVYRVDVEARTGGEVVAEFHGQIGLERTTPRRPYDFSDA